jgi:hypothetical protein
MPVFSFLPACAVTGGLRHFNSLLLCFRQRILCRSCVGKAWEWPLSFCMLTPREPASGTFVVPLTLGFPSLGNTSSAGRRKRISRFAQMCRKGTDGGTFTVPAPFRMRISFESWRKDWREIGFPFMTACAAGVCLRHFGGFCSLSLHPFITPTFYPSIYPSLHYLDIPSLRPSDPPPPFLHPSIHQSIHQSINQSINQSIHQSIPKFSNSFFPRKNASARAF